LARRRLAPRSAPYLAERVEVELVLLGLVAVMDPPRPEAEAAVRRCREAGIRLVMVTGDYGLTAESFARRLGMVTSDRPRIITGADFETMSDASLQAAIAEETLFARMAPEHKVRLVAAFQARGDVVALTGDGVNDVPALRKADVGIVMGLSGTDVAKEAADVVLAHDNIYDGVLAIEEGRGVFENLRKFITYIFASNVPQILPFILSATFGVPLTLSILQILAIDLGTDLLPALALGTERPEPELMHRPPRARHQPLIDGALLGRAFLWLGGIETALAYTGFLAVLAAAGSERTPLERLMHGLLPGAELERGWRLLPPAQDLNAHALAVTVFYAGVVMAQVGNAYACRTEHGQVRQIGWLGNPLLLVGILVEIGLLLVLVYIKPIAALFGHVAIPPVYWIGLSFYPLILYLLDWTRRYLVRLMGRLRDVRQGAGSS
ncbi:MAG: HAD-IC family P-type ATPase, partial [Chloroflexi bacterium]|nr:HAD-IC family P-type ATPase [Chloroflexota bacterium]